MKNNMQVFCPWKGFVTYQGFRGSFFKGCGNNCGLVSCDQFLLTYTFLCWASFFLGKIKSGPIHIPVYFHKKMFLIVHTTKWPAEAERVKVHHKNNYQMNRRLDLWTKIVGVYILWVITPIHRIVKIAKNVETVNCK